MTFILPNPKAKKKSNDPIFSIFEPDLEGSTSCANISFFGQSFKIGLLTGGSTSPNNSSWIARRGQYYVQKNAGVWDASTTGSFAIVGDALNPGFDIEFLCGSYTTLPSDASFYIGLNVNSFFTSSVNIFGTANVNNGGIGVAADSSDSVFSLYSRKQGSATSTKIPTSIPKIPNQTIYCKISSDKTKTNVKIKSVINPQNITTVLDVDLNASDIISSASLLKFILGTYSATAQHGCFLTDVRYRVKR
jgi:hypothetical protein